MNFLCVNCGQPISVKFLKPGEIAKCKSCGVDCVVPDDAIGLSAEQESQQYTMKQALRPADHQIEIPGTPKTEPVNVWIYRILAVNFFGGGILGTTSGFQALMSGNVTPGFVFFGSFFMAFFVWNIVVGIALLEKHPKSLRWARTIFIFLVPHFSSPALSYFIDSGLTVKTLFSFAPRTMDLMWMWAGGFGFGINQSGRPLVVGINIIAVFALIFFYVLNRSEKGDDAITKTNVSQNNTSEAQGS